ncbi:MAG TPA: ATP-binding protein, partial [Nitrospirales bacterium]|nr:ATP-binding protein [Nitrospirales bacterium]
LLLQSLEVFYPVFFDAGDTRRYGLVLRLAIIAQLLLASVLVAVTDGSGSIYELVYLLPIISASSKLPGRDVVLCVSGSIVAMIGFIVTGEQLTPSIARVKEFQDAVAAIVYFTMAGLLTYLFAEDERRKRVHYQHMAQELVARNGELRRLQVELSDRLAQLSQMEERVQRISQTAALGEMAGQIAHEVRNPLGIIKGAADMLAARITDAAVQRHIAVVQQEVERLNTAVDGILRLGSPVRIRALPCDVREILRGAVQTATASSAAPRHHVSAPLTDQPCWITGDGDLLHHAFANLIRNALQSMPHGGALTVGIESDPGHQVLVRITDTGVGLSPEALRKLGEPFFTTRPGGVGLGFSLAQRIVREHGGRIEVRSTPTIGTSVDVSLPVETHASGRPGLKASPHEEIAEELWRTF